ncbi:MAG: ergothioneine biosynthesis protein EgtB [Acidobacteriota bacterium]
MPEPSSATAAPEESGTRPSQPLTSLDRYRQVRAWTETLCEPLATEDYVVQSMADASPAKWHLAHTTWFFETFLLAPHVAQYRSPDERFNFLFNSYYNSVGAQHARPDRGLLSRPTVDEVYAYRHHVDDSMAELIATLGDDEPATTLRGLLEVGLNHEQQHQELMLTDVKHMLSRNPLQPAYGPAAEAGGAAANAPGEARWTAFEEGLYAIGEDAGSDGFAFDNEGPRHRAFVEAFELADRPVTNGEYLEFMADGGYQRPEFWLSDGWATVRAGNWRAPLYWHSTEDGWRRFSLSGDGPIDPGEPVCHISLYEADAYARWAGGRLPTEAEWEIAAERVFGRPRARGENAPDGNFAESRLFHPRPLPAGSAHGQMLGDVWEWTRSAYSPYPGYRPPAGALGEYNSKFMNNQTVLRGGSCATPRSHIRTTYRNFFPPAARWQFSGLRLARDGER